MDHGAAAGSSREQPINQTPRELREQPPGGRCLALMLHVSESDLELEKTARRHPHRQLTARPIHAQHETPLVCRASAVQTFAVSSNLCRRDETLPSSAARRLNRTSTL